VTGLLSNDQEDEKRFRPGTNKYIAFQLLKAAGSKGLTVPQIMEESKKAGLKEFDENAKRVVQFVSLQSPTLLPALCCRSIKCLSILAHWDVWSSCIDFSARQ
jgi:hypothetical protein